jgi:hypothetical protein
MLSTWLRRNEVGFPFKIRVKKEDIPERVLTNAVIVEILVMKQNKEKPFWTVDGMEQDGDRINVIHVIKEGEIDELGFYSLAVHIKNDSDETLLLRLQCRSRICLGVRVLQRSCQSHAG